MIILTGVLISSLWNPNKNFKVTSPRYKRGRSGDLNEGNCTDTEGLQWLQCRTGLVENAAKMAKIQNLNPILRGKELITFIKPNP